MSPASRMRSSSGSTWTSDSNGWILTQLRKSRWSMTWSHLEMEQTREKVCQFWYPMPCWILWHIHRYSPTLLGWNCSVFLGWEDESDWPGRPVGPDIWNPPWFRWESMDNSSTAEDFYFPCHHSPSQCAASFTESTGGSNYKFAAMGSGISNSLARRVWKSKNLGIPHNSMLFYKKSDLFRRDPSELTGTAWWRRSSWNSSFHPAYTIPCPNTTESVLLLEGGEFFSNPLIWSYLPLRFRDFC